MKKQRHHFYALIFLIALLSFNSCENAVDYLEDDTSSSGNKSETNITGIITDELGQPSSGVTVTVEGNNSVTNGFGVYFFEGVKVNRSRFIISARKQGYFDAVKAVTFIKTGTCHYSNLRLIPKIISGSFLSQNGGIINLNNGSSISFPQNAFIDQSGNAYNGNVKIYAKYLNSDQPDYIEQIPGGDLRAIDL